MKKIALAGTALALALAAGSAAAENSLNSGAFGLSVDTTPGTGVINGRYLVSSNLAVLGGFGLSNTSGTGGGTNWGIMAGVRNYMNTSDFAPFIGGRFTYNSFAGGNSNWTLGAEGGAEYFLAKHFSLEGRVGLGYGSQTTAAVTNPITGAVITPSVTTSVFGTTTFALGANFYF
jgi:hypothetical protein